MDSFFRLLLRLILIPTAVLVASTVQAAIALFGQWRLGTVMTSLSDDPGSGPGIFGAILAASLLTMMLLALIWAIASIGILFSEAFVVRSWLYHLANGVVSTFLAVQIFPMMLSEASPLDEPFYVLATGLAGGLTYWLIAGWGAGFWKPVLRHPPAAVQPPDRAPPSSHLPLPPA